VALSGGAHRWSAYKSTGVEEVKAVIKDLDGNDPLLYAAKKAIGPRQLTEDEARDTARRAYAGNSSLSSTAIGKAIGRSRQAVDAYIADLRAVNQMGRDIKIFRMHRLGIPQDRMAKRLGLDQKTIHYHLGKIPVLANSLNGDLRVTFRLSRGFTVTQVAQKHGWTDPMAGGGVTPDTCLAMDRRCWAP
jgi:biotin operon repressor